METREDKRSALDDFAASVKQDVAVVPMTAALSTLDQVHGAQAVAVKRDEAEILKKLRVLGAAGQMWIGQAWMFWERCVRGSARQTWRGA